MSGPGSPNNADRMKHEKGGTRGNDAEYAIKNAHDDGSDKRAVQHAERAEQGCHHEGEDNAFSSLHAGALRRVAPVEMAAGWAGLPFLPEPVAG